MIGESWLWLARPEMAAFRHALLYAAMRADTPVLVQLLSVLVMLSVEAPSGAPGKTRSIVATGHGKERPADD